jgi:hypothetical protein
MQTLQLSVRGRLVLGVGFALIVSLPLAAQNHSFGSRGMVHGVPPSVTSFGFGGGHGSHGVPPSVTSFGFGSVHSHSHARTCCFYHHRRVLTSPFYGVGYYIPYAYPFDIFEPGVDDSMEEDYRSGPTIFDRMGQGARDYSRDYVRPERPVEDEAATYDSRHESASQDSRANTPPEPQPVRDQPSTVLVFRDGHHAEVSNYAIVGSTLYDLSGGRTRKVALAELDLAATVKANDQNGVDFRLPNEVKLN